MSKNRIEFNTLLHGFILALVPILTMGCSFERIAVRDCGIHSHQETLTQKIESLAQKPEIRVLAIFGSASKIDDGRGYRNGWQQLNTRLLQSFSDYDVIYGSGEGALIASLAVSEPPSVRSSSLDKELLELDAAETSRASLWPRHKVHGLLRRILEEKPSQKHSSRVNLVAENAKKGLLLIVSVVNLDTGRAGLVDLTALAQRDTKEPSSCYAAAVMASAAYPVILPPVEIDSNLYMDGNSAKAPLVQVIRDLWSNDGSQVRNLTAIILGNPAGGRETQNKKRDLGIKRELEVIQSETIRSSITELYDAASSARMELR